MAKLLAFFLANPDRVVSREELIATVWENRVVSDDALNRCVSILRQTLSPGDIQAYIETVTRRGYIAHFPPAAAAQPDDTAADAAGPADRTWARSLPLTAAALITLALVALFAWSLRDARMPDRPAAVSAGEPPVVAVLPFMVSGESDDGRFFADGMHEDLLTQLAQLQALRVISRTSVLEYRDSSRNLREIGRELGTDAILEGSVQSNAGQVRINVQLIDTRTDAHLWAQTYDRVLSPENLFAVQTEIAQAIAAAMHTSLSAQDATQLSLLPTENMAAYRAYHEAMELRDSSRISDPAYIAALERAVALDPQYLRAWAELAGILSFQYFSSPVVETVERVEQIIEQLRVLAPGTAEYLIAQAYFTYYVLRNYSQAHELILRAQVMRPSDVRLLELKGWIERRLGAYEALIETSRQAQALDPRDPRRTVSLVARLTMAHRYEEASREIESSDFDNYELAILRSRLDLRSHRDFSQWESEVAMLQREFEREADPTNLWDALVANREFVEARTLARQLPEDFDKPYGVSPGGITDKIYYEILSAWFLQQAGSLEELLADARRELEERRLSAAPASDLNETLARALLLAAGGQAEEAERLVRRWQRETGDDLAEWLQKRHIACRVLGMAAAASSAVDCLRDSFDRPSQAAPFIEPYLPYYDLIRDEPVFAKLLI